MEFKSIGKVIFEGSEYSSEYIRKQINNIKKNILRNIDEEECVAIAVERNQLMLCLIMAFVESNITFLPIDLELPENRINYMIENANIKHIIVSQSFNKKISENCNKIQIEELINKNNTIDIKEKEICNFKNPVYYLFTSGSTGNPKAVVVNPKGFFNFLKSIPTIISFQENDRIACFTTISFDIFFLESVLALINGLTVVLANSEEQSNPRKMIALIKSQNITMLQATPSRLKLLSMFDDSFSSLSNLKTIMVGGEKFPIDLLESLQSKTNAKIYNMYGPTETTIWSTVSDLTNEKDINIGEPIANTQIFLLDNREKLVLDGQEGEICIAGDGLSDGYYNNSELTNKNFINLPFEPYKKIYCTGDLGKYENNKLICLGRIDNQVKINGYRIELEEIENTIKKLFKVKDCVVCFDTDNNQLIAFYISDELEENDTFISGLKSYLPEYMIPAIFSKSDEFTYTTSGKIDRKKMLLNYKESILEKNNVNLNDSIDSCIISIIKNELQSDICILPETKIETLSLNSMKYVSIIVSLEDEFNFEFDEEYLIQNNFSTVQEIIEYVKEHKID